MGSFHVKKLDRRWKCLFGNLDFNHLNNQKMRISDENLQKMGMMGTNYNTLEKLCRWNLLGDSQVLPHLLVSAWPIDNTSG